MLYQKSFQKDTQTFQRGPKIVHPELIKISDKRIMPRRKICSEERPRLRSKIKSLHGNGMNSPE